VWTIVGALIGWDRSFVVHRHRAMFLIALKRRCRVPHWLLEEAIICGYAPCDDDRNALRGGHETAFGMAPERDQRIVLGVICPKASLWDIIGVHDETSDTGIF
jgi:hypothetical protein